MIRQIAKMARLLTLPLLALGASACTGSVNLDVTDAPVDKAKKVVVQFSGATFQPTGANAVSVTFDPPLSIDLLALRDGNTASLISGKKLPDGKYDSITLSVNAVGDGSDSYVVLSSDPSTQYPLALTAGNLTLSGGFSVDKDKTENYVIDFDLRKSVLDPLTSSTVYRLAPSLRLVNEDDSGRISGTVTGAGATGCTPAVYVYQGSGATLGDEGSANPPYASALIRQDSTSGDYTYTVAFLPAGSYTLAATCDAEQDSVETSGDITLGNPVNVTVRSGAATTQNFSL